jgi:hypothetical protein
MNYALYVHIDESRRYPQFPQGFPQPGVQNTRLGHIFAGDWRSFPQMSGLLCGKNRARKSATYCEKRFGCHAQNTGASSGKTEDGI